MQEWPGESHSEDWNCRECGHWFDEPDQVVSYGGVRDDTVAGLLEDLDASDVVPPRADQ